jgi:hypothetical protein
MLVHTHGVNEGQAAPRTWGCRLTGSPARPPPAPEQGILSAECSDMHQSDLQAEAEACRKKALAYLGRPEATFLLKAAREFERLAREPQHRTEVGDTPWSK